MADVTPQLQDHVMGLEMQIVELARQADQAAHEGWPDQEAELRDELQTLYSELASVADQLTDEATATSPPASLDAEPAGNVSPGGLLERPPSS